MRKWFWLFALLVGVLPVGAQGAFVLNAGDSVVIKGSFGSKMGPIAEALRQRFSTFQKEGH